MTNTADRLLTRIRTLIYAAERGLPTTGLAGLVRDLDAHLSNGGAPPEAWREGPDAPYLDDAHPEDCAYYAAGESMRHAYEPPQS